MGQDFYGDHGPVSVWRNGKQVAGAVKREVSGTGRVGWEAPYKAGVPAVKVYGKGEQGRLEGYNLLIPNTDPKDTLILGTTIETGGRKYEVSLDGTITVYPIDTSKSGGTQYFSNNAHIKLKAGTTYTTREMNYRLKHADGSFSSAGGYEVAYSFVAQEGDEIDGAWLWFGAGFPKEKRVFHPMVVKGRYNDQDMPPFEPYCGGIPAPNPEYPIEPKFLEGAKVVGRGRNLIPPEVIEKASWNIFAWRSTNTGYFIRKGISYTLHANFNATGLYFNLKSALEHKNLATKYHATELTYIPSENSEVWLDCYVNTGIPEDGMIWLTCDSTPTPYEPYFDGGSADIPILRAIPDSDIQDEYDVTTGVLTRRIYELNLSKDIPPNNWEAWESSGIIGYWCSWYNDSKIPSQLGYPAPSVCTHFKTALTSNLKNDNEGYVGYSSFNATCSRFSDINSFLNWLSKNDVKLWYALAEPITEHYDPAVFKQHPGYTQLIQSGGFADTEIRAEAWKEMGAP